MRTLLAALAALMIGAAAPAPELPLVERPGAERPVAERPGAGAAPVRVGVQGGVQAEARVANPGGALPGSMPGAGTLTLLGIGVLAVAAVRLALR